MHPTVRPERLVAGGDALARGDDGRIVFVRGALPGELVEVEVESARRDFARALVTKIVDPSPDRVVEPCAHRRAGCGGCDWMHLDPRAQLAAKVGIVEESLRRIGKVDAAEVDRAVVAGAAVDALGYRTTIRVVGTADGRVAFREQASDRIVPVDDCPVAHPRLSAILADLRVDPGVELTLRTSVATGATTARWDRRAGEVRGFPDDVHVGRRAWLDETVAGRRLRVSAASFFQSGPQAADLLVDAVVRAAPELGGAGHAVDAYGGVGLFAATAMAGCRRVTVVESSRSACDDAEHNLARRDAAVVRSEVARWEPSDDVDVVVADPARPGLGRPGVAAIARTHPAPLVLVSCDPVSLARDARLLLDSGYRLGRVEVLDPYPQTHHVETVTRFTPA